MEFHLELNIALIPEPLLAARHTALSRKLAADKPALVRLGSADPRLALAPHLTLYQVPVPVGKLARLDAVLRLARQHLSAEPLGCTGYAYNADEGSFEASYETTDWLVGLQEDIIARLNPLRAELLLERDPAGNKLVNTVMASGPIGDNVRATGYGEVGDPRQGGLFRPHVTLDWLEPGTAIDPHDPGLPAAAELTGMFPHIGVYALGPYGTCPQRLAVY